MVDLIILYIGSIVISVVIDIIHKNVMIKDLADNNLKLNFNGLDDIDEKELDNKYYLLIPIYNIAKSLNDYVMYKNDIYFLTKAYRDNLVKEFNSIEREEYSKHPNIINANLLEYKIYFRRKYAHSIQIDDSIIYYKLSVNKGLEVVDSEGSLSYESRNYQTNKLYSAIESSLDEVVEKTIDSVEDKEEYLKQIQMTKEYLQNAKKILEEQKDNKKLIKAKK